MELAVILTAAGATGAAALITTLIQILKSTFTFLDNGYEKKLALAFSAVLVAAAFASVGIVTFATVFSAFVAWLAIAKLSTGIYDEVTAQPGSFRGGDAP